MRTVLLAAVLAGSVVPTLQSQVPDTSKKGRELIQQAIEALGGDAFLNLKTEKAEAKIYSFHRNNLSSLATATQYIGYPDKEREEYGKRKDEIEIINGNKGWTLDPSGVRPIPQAEMQSYLERQSMSALYILRYRLKEPDSILEYAGHDILDNREVDLVNFIDARNRTATYALDSATHLPSQLVWERRDPKTGERRENTEVLSNYSKQQGVAMPRHLLRKENDVKVYEEFIQDVQYNLDLDELLFIPPVIIPSGR